MQGPGGLRQRRARDRVRRAGAVCALRPVVRRRRAGRGGARARQADSRDGARSWGFGKEANTSASFLLGKYRKYVDALPERRKRFSPIFVLGVGIHSGASFSSFSSRSTDLEIDAPPRPTTAWNVQETLDLHLSPFLAHAASSSPRPLAFFSGYPAVPPNKPPTYLPRQGAKNTQQYNADVRELLEKVSPGEASEGAWTMLDWYGVTDGGPSRSFSLCDTLEPSLTPRSGPQRFRSTERTTRTRSVRSRSAPLSTQAADTSSHRSRWSVRRSFSTCSTWSGAKWWSKAGWSSSRSCKAALALVLLAR